MDNNELKIKVIADISGLQDGFNRGKDVVDASSKVMAQALAAAKVQATAYTQAMRDLGAAAAAGNQQATTAIAGHLEALKAAKARVEELASANERLQAQETQVAEWKSKQARETLLAEEAAQREARAKELLALRNDILARSEDNATAATGRSVTAMQAAGAEMGVLEGRIPTRAVENFAVKILGLGPIIQGAFAAFGFVAAAEVIADFGQKLYDAFDLGGKRARKAQQEVRDFTGELERSTLAMQVQIDKLQQEQARLEKKPFNGLKLVLDEAAESARNLAKELQGLTGGKVLESLKDLDTNFLQRTVTGKVGTHEEQVSLSEHQKWVDQAPNLQKQLDESQRWGTMNRQRLAELEKLQTASKNEADLASLAGSPQVAKDYSPRINALKTLIDYQEKEQEQIETAINLDKQRGVTQQARDAVGMAKIGNSADADELRRAEEGFQRLKNSSFSVVTGHGVTPAEEAAYWQQYLGRFKDGSSEAIHVYQQYNQAIQQEAQKAHQTFEKNAEIIKRVSAMDTETPLASNHGGMIGTSTQWEQARRAEERTVEITAQANARIAESRIAIDAVNGKLTPLAAAWELQRQHVEEFADAMKRLNKEMEDWNDRSKHTDMTDAQRQEQKNNVSGKIAALDGQKGLTAQQDQQNIASKMAKPYIDGFNMIDSAWLQTQNALIWGTKSISKEFANMGARLVMSVATSFEKMMAEQVRHQIMSIASADAANHIKQTNEISSQAVGLALHKQNAKEEGTVDAKSAAVGAFKWVMKEVPTPLNWVLAPAAAAAAFAGAASLMSFSIGGTVPETNVALVHKGERVLTERQNQAFEGALSGGFNSTGGNSSAAPAGDTHYHTWNVTVPAGTTQKQAKQTAAMSVRELKTTLRNAGLHSGS